MSELSMSFALFSCPDLTSLGAELFESRGVVYIYSVSLQNVSPTLGVLLLTFSQASVLAIQIVRDIIPRLGLSY